MDTLYGYKLIRLTDGMELESWGGILGQCPGIPNPLVLPNGTHIGAASPGVDYDGYTLVEWHLDNSTRDDTQ